MKCPNCSSTCSDLRDICPKCYVDLRPAKKDLHIPITHPHDSYESLRAKVTSAAERPSVLASLSSLLRGADHGSKNSLEEPEHRAPVESSPSRPTELAKNLEPRSEPPPNALQGMLRPAPYGAHTQLSPPTPQRIPHLTAGAAALDDHLFIEANDELTRFELEGLDLPSDTFHQISNRDEVQLLFELSDEALLNPQSEARYTEEVFTKPLAELGSELFKRELAKIEGALEPELIPLAAFQRREAGAGPALHRSSRKAPLPPPRIRVLSAWAADTGITIVFGLLVALVVLWSDSPDTLASFLASPGSHPWALADYLGYLLVSLFVVGIAHPLLAACVRSPSLGMQTAGLRYCLADGEEPSREALLLRAGMAPLSLLLGAPLLQFLNRRGLAEHYSSLFVSTRYGDSHPS